MGFLAPTVRGVGLERGWVCPERPRVAPLFFSNSSPDKYGIAFAAKEKQQRGKTVKGREEESTPRATTVVVNPGTLHRRRDYCSGERPGVGGLRVTARGF